MLIERYQRLDELIKKNDLLQSAQNTKSMASVNASADKHSAKHDAKGIRGQPERLAGSQ